MVLVKLVEVDLEVLALDRVAMVVVVPENMEVVLEDQAVTAEVLKVTVALEAMVLVVVVVVVMVELVLAVLPILAREVVMVVDVS